MFESAGRVGVTVAAICAVAAAQAPQPFLPPHADPHHSLSTRVAMLDANRDGQEDVIAPGFVFGSLLVTIDEHGRQLASSPVDAGFVANPRAAVSPTPIAVAGVDLDGDSRKDYVFVTSDGGVHVQHNRGAERFAAVDFGPPQTLDQLGQMLPNAPPLSRITVAAIVSGDFDGDGTVDLAVGFGVHDLWNGLAKPGLIACYLADGVGGFTPHRVPVAGSVIDLEWADLDGDGSAEHFVAIVEQGGVGAWFHNLVHLRLHNQTLVATGPAISLGQTRHVALEIGDVDLDGLPDYVCAVLDTDGNAV
ncbi:MAG: VCBS repeat-containing protein, partial [Planctomycetes bacterium]|nr:VCBS repeat-containing protein [Planctomycetota bacterium]